MNQWFSANVQYFPFRELTSTSSHHSQQTDRDKLSSRASPHAGLDMQLISEATNVSMQEIQQLSKELEKNH